MPACPCKYPSSIFYDDRIWDKRYQKYFRWRDVSGKSERLDVYKSGATYCVRSMLAQGNSSAAAQHCCYDEQRRLITRGSGAGTPNFVSPEISPELHARIDILPWQLCKGDFSRFDKNKYNSLLAYLDENISLRIRQKNYNRMNVLQKIFYKLLHVSRKISDFNLKVRINLIAPDNFLKI